MTGNKSALIFGASGVSGWAFVNEILNDYPKKGVWNKVYALTNRPLTQEDSEWPKDERLSIVSGIDLLQGSQDDLEAVMKEKIGGGISKITHVYYLAYKASNDAQKELEEALAMFKRAVTAIDTLSSALDFVVLQTGAKMYGCHLLENRPKDIMHLPLAESLPRVPPPHHDLLFYHPQLDWLTSFAANKSWNWCDTRPDIIIGFVPNQNFYSLGSVLGIYLSLFRAVEGKNAKCPFPGSGKSWVAKSLDSSSDMIARQTIHLSLTLPPTKKGEAFNVADAKHYESWSTKWPQLCAYFGLIGTGPSPPDTGSNYEVRKYIRKHINVWNELEKKHGLKTGHADSSKIYEGFEYFLLTQFDFDRQYDMTKMYLTGFEEERSVMQAWGGVFDRMRGAKLIP
ncbi:hypothetical protein AJ80_01938 [Polytolypa hystricis UAMH7299]|uniref:PRISE-like Rossmann-fold domain-containing protein n=1 Tax=Polytolypa hystricis (strain UAMH7299) TaxID=1447883 RepID=A0A2B7YZ68_POLH7|nr:hypothetical protein AJ80_01938 [Polytolypa hystricis UAMH7299]